jgi:hypothetical protein
MMGRLSVGSFTQINFQSKKEGGKTNTKGKLQSSNST